MYCTNCGQKNQDVAKFCFSCGNQLYSEKKIDKVKSENNPKDNIAEQCILNHDDANLQNDYLNNHRYNGVRGWLLFYCISLLVIAPVTIISNKVLYHINLLNSFSYLPKLYVAIFIDTLLYFFIIGFGIYNAIFH